MPLSNNDYYTCELDNSALNMILCPSSFLALGQTERRREPSLLLLYNWKRLWDRSGTLAPVVSASHGDDFATNFLRFANRVAGKNRFCWIEFVGSCADAVHAFSSTLRNHR